MGHHSLVASGHIVHEHTLLVQTRILVCGSLIEYDICVEPSAVFRGITGLRLLGRLRVLSYKQVYERMTSGARPSTDVGLWRVSVAQIVFEGRSQCLNMLRPVLLG